MSAVATEPPGRGLVARIAWVAAAAGVVMAAIFLVLFVRSANKKNPIVRSEIVMEEGTFPLLTGDFAGPPTVSRDGSAVAFVAARQDGAVLLWVRPLNSLHARALPGTDSATLPFWSPDSHSLGYFAGGKLKTLSIDGGSPPRCVPLPSAAVEAGTPMARSSSLLISRAPSQKSLQQVALQPRSR